MALLVGVRYLVTNPQTAETYVHVENVQSVSMPIPALVNGEPVPPSPEAVAMVGEVVAQMLAAQSEQSLPVAMQKAVEATRIGPPRS